MGEPLKLSRKNWRSRWLQTARGTSLHRVSAIKWEDPPDRISGEGETVCGKRGWLSMPGIFSRMGATRCRQCCKALGIPQGAGAPFNALTGEQADV